MLFLSPTLLVYGLFLFVPIIACFFIAFSSYDILRPMEFNGLKNFIRLFTDQRTSKIYWTTLKLTVMLVILHTVIGLSLALLVRSFQSRLLQGFSRVIYYLPCILTTASVAISWRYILNTDLGVMNYFLGKLGIEAIAWLNHPIWVYGTISIFSIWKFVGTIFLYFYIGLGNIPRTYYEAAQIDGSGAFSTFRRITLPLLTPTLFFVVLNLFIMASQIFDEPFFLTGGGPNDATRTVNLYIYETAYREFNFGYSSAIAISLFFILAVFTLVQMKTSKKWVSYDH